MPSACASVTWMLSGVLVAEGTDAVGDRFEVGTSATQVGRTLDARGRAIRAHCRACLVWLVVQYLSEVAFERVKMTGYPISGFDSRHAQPLRHLQRHPAHVLATEALTHIH